VVLADEGQGKARQVLLSELRLLCSARLDSHLLLTVVLAGDQRLAERFRCDELAPLASRAAANLLRVLPPHWSSFYASNRALLAAKFQDGITIVPIRQMRKGRSEIMLRS
jgi:type II secretory pathway predicted ATPase ExeA